MAPFHCGMEAARDAGRGDMQFSCGTHAARDAGGRGEMQFSCGTHATRHAWGCGEMQFSCKAHAAHHVCAGKKRFSLGMHAACDTGGDENVLLARMLLVNRHTCRM